MGILHSPLYMRDAHRLGFEVALTHDPTFSTTYSMIPYRHWLLMRFRMRLAGPFVSRKAALSHLAADLASGRASRYMEYMTPAQREEWDRLRPTAVAALAAAARITA